MKRGKAGGSAGRRRAVQRRLPRARAAFCRRKAVCGVRRGKTCACLGARERSERVTGRRQPPCQRSCRLVSKTSTRFTANCPIWTVLRGAFEETFGVGKVLRFFSSIRRQYHALWRGCTAEIWCPTELTQNLRFVARKIYSRFLTQGRIKFVVYPSKNAFNEILTNICSWLFFGKELLVEKKWPVRRRCVLWKEIFEK